MELISFIVRKHLIVDYSHATGCPISDEVNKARAIRAYRLLTGRSIVQAKANVEYAMLGNFVTIHIDDHNTVVERAREQGAVGFNGQLINSREQVLVELQKAGFETYNDHRNNFHQIPKKETRALIRDAAIKALQSNDYALAHRLTDILNTDE